MKVLKSRTASKYEISESIAGRVSSMCIEINDNQLKSKCHNYYLHINGHCTLSLITWSNMP